MNTPRLFALLLRLRRAVSSRVYISAVRHSFLGKIEIIALGVMSTVGGKRPIRWPLQHGNLGILGLDPPDRFIDIVDVDAEMMQPRDIAWLATDHGHSDVTVTDA